MRSTMFDMTRRRVVQLPLSLVERIMPDYTPGRQEDAMEYLQQMLLKIHNVQCPVTDYNTSCQAGCLAKLFAFNTVSDSTCNTCGLSSSPATYLGIPVTPRGSLEDGIKRAAERDYPDGPVDCTACGSQQQFKLQLTTATAPSVLCVQFIRFDSLLKKIPHRMDYELDLKLTIHSDGEGQSVHYSLMAVVCHYGETIQSGHYDCYVRTKETNWLRVNDERITICHDPPTSLSDAYILFYSRNETVPFDPRNLTPAVSTGAYQDTESTIYTPFYIPQPQKTMKEIRSTLTEHAQTGLDHWTPFVHPIFKNDH